MRSTQPSHYPPAPIACAGSRNGSPAGRSWSGSDVVVEQLTPKVHSLVERCVAIDWRHPRHDPMRVEAAYERWLDTLGLTRRVRWVADPADVEAWRARGDGIANVWAIMAAANPASASTIGLILTSEVGPGRPRWSPPSSNISNIPAAWAFAITSHLTAVEGAWDAWAAAWAEMAASRPRIAWAFALLCPGVLWPAPPMIARAASDALSACVDRTIWAALADVLTSSQSRARAEGQLSAGGVPPTREQMIAALIAVAEPMIEACEAGAFAHTLLDQEIIVLASPAISTDGRRLHRTDGPVLAWPQTRVYGWKGVLLPSEAIVEPATITPDAIRAVTDERLQHALIDIYAHNHGHRRCMQDLGGIVMHEDHTGRLWWVNASRPLPPQPGDLKLVEVMNGTAEPDGSRKTYWLNVPPEMQTARQAVAWTYGMTPTEYDGLV